MIDICGIREDSMNKPIISIIVPVYNVEKYLKRCVESILEQTMKEIEIILVDDGSPDNCPTMCDEYAAKDARVKVVHKENGGLGFARNSGLDIASGEYVAFVDSDDYITNDMCEKLYEAAIRNKADIVYGGVWKKDNSSDECKSISDFKEEMVWGGNEQVTTFLLNLVGTECTYKKDTIMEVSVWKALFKKSIFDEKNIRFVSERQFISEDLIFDIDFIPYAKCIVVIPDCIYYYCYNPDSLSKVFRKDRFVKGKELYKEVEKKLSILYSEKIYRKHLDRLLIARSRAIAHQIAHCYKNLGKKEAKNLLEQICNDSDLQEILSRYPIKKMPKKYAAVAYLMKKRWTTLLLYILMR